jgi:hypothetical protein
MSQGSTQSNSKPLQQGPDPDPRSTVTVKQKLDIL